MKRVISFVVGLVIFFPLFAEGRPVSVKFSWQRPATPTLIVTWPKGHQDRWKVTVNGKVAYRGKGVQKGENQISLARAKWKGPGNQDVAVYLGPSQTPCWKGGVNKPWRLPKSRPNSRFFKDHFDLPRPCLSLRGFDRTNLGKYQHRHSHTVLGVRQVIERAYGVGRPPTKRMKRLWRKLITWSHRPYDRKGSNSRNRPEENTAIVQAQALLALVSYIRKVNHIPSSYRRDWGHEKVRHRLVQALTSSRDNQGNWIRHPGWRDAPKMASSIMKMARALDFYYALENAYEDLAGPVGKLLNRHQKKNLLTMMNREIYKCVTDTTYDFSRVLNITPHTTQPGNWALKSLLGAGYATLGQNGPPLLATGKLPSGTYEKWLNLAFQSAAFHRYTAWPRLNYWRYQSHGGRPLWAEGAYYFRWALREVIPFWHVIRGNDLLSWGKHAPSVDPFFHQAFLGPLQWLADISCPDGTCPPLDDGNRSRIDVAGLLSWSPKYGRGSLGRQYATIRDTLGGPGINTYHLPLEMAIPPASSASPLPSVVGKKGASPLVWRDQVNGETHYLLLNGESKPEIERGEGHEQPDQLQLLYYVGKKSLLVDSGYDRVTVRLDWKNWGWIGSTWNGYGHHNVIQWGGREKPLPSAKLSLWKRHVVAGHRPVEDLAIEKKGQVVSLYGYQRLGRWGRDHYRRQVLWIRGKKPYLIDINTVARPTGTRKYTMVYHGGSNHVSKWAKGRGWTWGKKGDLSGWFDIAEGSGETVKITSDTTYRERLGPVKKLVRLTIGGRERRAVTAVAFFQEGPKFSRPPQVLGKVKGLVRYSWERQGGRVRDFLVVRPAATGRKKAKTVAIPWMKGKAITISATSPAAFVRTVKVGGRWQIDKTRVWGVD